MRRVQTMPLKLTLGQLWVKALDKQSRKELAVVV